jgi:hypothetical protein
MRTGILQKGTSVLVQTIAALAFATAAHAAGRSIYVTVDGTDSGSCGSQQSPCRSISQGIENAVDGDSILVGAGRYGNISGNPTFGGTGDEHPQVSVAGQGGQPDGCIICINKAISLYSLHGASVTIIEGLPGTPYGANVQILSDGVVLGAPGRGFTITGGNTHGVYLDQETTESALGFIWKRKLTVAGNIDIGDSVGFDFRGRFASDEACPDPICLTTAAISFNGNESIDNSNSGFYVIENAWSGGAITIEGNYARGAGVGFNVPGGIEREGSGSGGSTHTTLTGNVATHNGLGFLVDGAASMRANTAAGNSQAGYQIVPGHGYAFQNNTAVGNRGPGAIVQFSTDGDDIDSANRFSLFTQNNFYGNDRSRPPLSISFFSFGQGSYNPGPGAHCGILNLGALAAIIGVFPVAPLPPPTITLPANGNFWGTTHGPSPTGAADAFGGHCDQNGGVTSVKTFATTGFAITTAN